MTITVTGRVTGLLTRSVVTAALAAAIFVSASAASAQTLRSGSASVTLPGTGWSVSQDGMSAERSVGPDNWLRASIRLHRWSGGVATDVIARRLAAHGAMMPDAGYADTLFEDYDTDVAGHWCHGFQALSSGAPEGRPDLPKDLSGALCPLGTGDVVEMTFEGFTRGTVEQYADIHVDAGVMYDSLTLH